MDCPTAQSHLLDELYGELDVDTSVELATHLAGCAACSAKRRELQAFRADFPVPPIEVPPGLTERIMARVDEAAASQAASPPLAAIPSASRAHAAPRPWLRALSPAISRAGAWAMRPQTAMAAVFVLMVGSSAWLLGRGHGMAASDQASQELEQGAPLAAPAGASSSDFDPEAARGAHGLAGAAARSPTAAGAPAAAAPSPAPVEAAEAKAKHAAADSEERGASSLGGHDDARRELAADKKSEAPPPAAAFDGYGAETSPAKGGPGGGMSGAMQLYSAGRWDDATDAFDVLARQGDSNAALWAARSVREGHGCRTALTRFDHLAGTALGTPAGNDATMEGGLCYRRLNLIDASTQRFQRLLAYEGYSAKARAEIEANHRILVARKEAEGAAAGGGGAAAGRAAPKAAKPAADTQRSGPRALSPHQE